MMQVAKTEARFFSKIHLFCSDTKWKRNKAALFWRKSAAKILMQLYYHLINGIGTTLAEPERTGPLKKQGM